MDEYTAGVRITWDAEKSEANVRKHGVSFEEAQMLFVSGADYLELFDEPHSDDEDRFVAVGSIARGLVLVVWTERDEELIRIISARWATPNERTLYLNALGGRT